MPGRFVRCAQRLGMFFILVRVAMAAAPVAAQEVPQQVPQPREERPYRGVFAHAPEASEQLLTGEVRGGVGGERGLPLTGVDPASTTSLSDDALNGRQGAFALGSAQLRYTLDRDKFDLGASAAVQGRSYQGADSLVSSGVATLGASVRPFKTLTLSASQSGGRQPYTLQQLIPALFEAPLGEAALVNEDLAIRSDPYTSWASSASIAQTIPVTKRSSFVLDYGYQRVESTASWLQQDLQSHTAGGTFRQGLTRDLGFHLGYHYRREDYPREDVERRLEAHNLDAGIDVNHAFSLTRRTTLTFSSGSSAYTWEDRTEYRVTGDARLTREFGRTWAVFGGYGRNIGFVDTLDAPVRYDRVTAGVTGLFTRRLQFETNVRASTGELGLGTTNGYWTTSATMTMTQALTRWLALGGSYSYYRYSFDSSAYLPGGTVLNTNRQSARVYLTVWAPLLHRARKPHAAR